MAKPGAMVSRVAPRAARALAGHGTTQHRLFAALDHAIAVPTPAIVGSVARLRRAHPDDNPAQIIGRLERRFLRTVTSSGFAVGATAAVPGAGTATAVTAVGGETALFLAAGALLTLSIAEVHGYPVDDVEQRRALVLAVALGDSGTMLVQSATERLGKNWTGFLAGHMPKDALRRMNAKLARKFALRFAARQGVNAIGTLTPMGIGAVIGASGNRAMGHRLVRNARDVFGPPPRMWPSTRTP